MQRRPRSIINSLSHFKDDSVIKKLAGNYEELFSEAVYQTVEEFINEWQHLS